ncbi:MAG: formylglycine-generating enzyme family protein, partial [Pirellulales bacterium]|nr:formylglycine-generating enzyme family protein [Pirellulales bacterium]
LSIENGLTPCYYRDSGYMDVVDATDYINDDHYCNFEADGYRLPTEGEWEYFTRAGTTDPFSCDELNYSDETCGSPYCEPGEFSVLEDYAVYCANDNGESEPVGSKLGNPWNLKDVYGNVWEWCWDWYDVYPSGNEVDYPGAETGSPRVTRGGNWQTAARYCRSAQRNYYWPDNRIYSGGFRLLRATN